MKCPVDGELNKITQVKKKVDTECAQGNLAAMLSSISRKLGIN
mgnify:CR=1 FL=1